MDLFTYINGQMHCEAITLKSLAKEYGTPLFVYSKTTLRRHCAEFQKAFASYPSLACFAVKANSTIGYLKTIAEAGLGADIVSVGELERCLLAGFAPEKIIFSGVGKTNAEMARALDVGIYCFNVESPEELSRLSALAAAKKVHAPISFRVNPNIDARTNPKISTGLYDTKFGISEEETLALITQTRSLKNIKLIGLSCHIGSQILELAPLVSAAERMVSFARKVNELGVSLEFLSMGGGVGIRYKDEVPPTLTEYAEAILEVIKPLGIRLLIEPGRVIAGNTGVLLTEVVTVKTSPKKNFLVVDASMSELMRPALYGSYHDMLPVEEGVGPQVLYDVVGPVCETTDILGDNRTLPVMQAGNLVAIRGCGAYGSSMSSNYNSRPRAAEVMVDGSSVRVLRSRELLSDLWSKELF